MSLNTGFSFAGAVPLRSDSGPAVLSGNAGQTAGAAFEAALQEVGAGGTRGVSGGIGAGGAAGFGSSADTGTGADARSGIAGRALIGWCVPTTQSEPAERAEGEALPSTAPVAGQVPASTVAPLGLSAAGRPASAPEPDLSGFGFLSAPVPVSVSAPVPVSVSVSDPASRPEPVSRGAGTLEPQPLAGALPGASLQPGSLAGPTAVDPEAAAVTAPAAVQSAGSVPAPVLGGTADTPSVAASAPAPVQTGAQIERAHV